jgi:uncharacterized membrane protein
MDRLDRLVEDYLGAVSYACRDLPPDRRDDLVSDLREHIAAGRTVLYQPTEAAIRTILDRLGEPTAIAAEARLAEGLVDEPSPPARSQNRAPAEPPNRWLSQPLSPTAVTILAALTLVAITIMVIGYIAANREPPPPR